MPDESDIALALARRRMYSRSSTMSAWSAVFTVLLLAASVLPSGHEARGAPAGRDVPVCHAAEVGRSGARLPPTLPGVDGTLRVTPGDFVALIAAAPVRAGTGHCGASGCGPASCSQAGSCGNGSPKI